MSGYTIGLIIEGVVALALIVAIVAVAINKRKPAKKKVPELNGLSGYIGGGGEESTATLLLAGQTAEAPQEPAQSTYGYEEQAYGQPPAQEQYAAPAQSTYGYEEQAYEQPPVQEQYAALGQSAYGYEEQAYEQPPVQEQYAAPAQGTYGYEEQAYGQPPVQEQYAAPAQSTYGYEEQTYGQPPAQEQYAAPAQEADAASAQGDAPQGSDGHDDDLVSFRSVERTFEDAFAELSEEQKRYFSEIMAYALSKPKAEEKVTKGAVCVRSNKKLILKLKIRRKITVASFKLENDLLRDYRHNIGDASAIRMRETEIYVNDDSAKETAFGMIDLMLEQYERERQEALERRRLARAAKRAEQAADRAAEEAAAADAAAEDEEQ